MKKLYLNVFLNIKIKITKNRFVKMVDGSIYQSAKVYLFYNFIFLYYIFKKVNNDFCNLDESYNLQNSNGKDGEERVLLCKEGFKTNSENEKSLCLNTQWSFIPICESFL